MVYHAEEFVCTWNYVSGQEIGIWNGHRGSRLVVEDGRSGMEQGGSVRLEDGMMTWLFYMKKIRNGISCWKDKGTVVVSVAWLCQVSQGVSQVVYLCSAKLPWEKVIRQSIYTLICKALDYKGQMRSLFETSPY